MGEGIDGFVKEACDRDEDRTGITLCIMGYCIAVRWMRVVRHVPNLVWTIVSILVTVPKASKVSVQTHFNMEWCKLLGDVSQLFLN